MRKVLSRLGALAVIVVVMVSFTACSLFTQNLDKKYSAEIMVASMADSGIAVSRKELYYAYMEWGYQYANNMETAELLEYITTALLNDKILKQVSLDKFGALRDSEKAYARKQAFDSLNDAIAKYVQETLDIADTTDSESAETADSAVTYQPFTKYLDVEQHGANMIYTLNLDQYRDESGNSSLRLSDYPHFTPKVPYSANAKTVKQAVSKVVRNLQSIENGFEKLPTPENFLNLDSPYLNFLTDKERATLNRELQRMIQANEKTILVARIETAYQLGLIALEHDAAVAAWDAYLTRMENWESWVATINGVQADGREQPGRAVATNMATNAVNYYCEKVTNAINSNKNFPVENLESTIMGGKLGDYYYVPADVANNLFTVSHILIGFTDDQKAEYERINSEAERNPSYNPQADLNALYAQTMSNGKTAHEIYLEVQDALAGQALADKYQIFRDLIYQYNTDPGMQNPDYEYLMSANAENNSMIEAFTNASIELFNNGEKGAISGLVWGTYGAHIIMYTRNLSDFVFTSAVGAEEQAIALVNLNYADTLFAPLTAYGNKTRFDALVDAFFKRSYANYRAHLLSSYKHDHEVTMVTSEFKKFL